MFGSSPKNPQEAAMAQAAANPDLQVENTKEFFAMWTNMADKCFRRCIPLSNTRFGEKTEMECLKNCVNKHVQANHRTVKDFTLSQETFMKKDQEAEDARMKAYIAQGIFDQNLELIPTRPKSPEELEIEMIENNLGSNVGKFYRWYLGIPPAENQSS